MITQTAVPWQTPTWKEELSGAFRSVDDLLQFLELDGTDLALQSDSAPPFPIRVPVSYARRMRKGDPEDPLLRQVLPLQAETLTVPGFVADPLEEARHNPVPGVVHKYEGRVLLITSPACAVHCRYCFRRHFPYEDNTGGKAHWQPALDYIAGDLSVREVILSGGDPLAANDNQLQWLTDQLARIGHIRRLRVHSRFPVVIPSRIDDPCLSWLGGSRLDTIMVLHINHPAEIDSNLRAMVARLKDRNITVLNQAVLLKGVNDSAESLELLSEALFAAGVLPYYLHLLDPVAGASHFDLPVSEALALYRTLSGRLPGYLLPKLVQDVPGKASKTYIV